jgi:hypothetical protein
MAAKEHKAAEPQPKRSAPVLGRRIVGSASALDSSATFWLASAAAAEDGRTPGRAGEILAYGNGFDQLQCKVRKERSGGVISAGKHLTSILHSGSARLSLQCNS